MLPLTNMGIVSYTMKTYLEEPDMSSNSPSVERVAAISIYGNLLLSLLKLLAGLIAHSGAMISDAVHSASDVFSSIIVIIGAKMAKKSADADHPYGHERLESVAAIVLSVILLVTGLFIGHTAIEKLNAGSSNLIIPGIPALIAAIISILVKEWMFQYTRHHARRMRSDALMADAWHHRSDALSSIGALVGIAASRLGYTYMDPIASLVICLFIVKASYDIFRDSTRKMVDHSCDESTQEAMKTMILAEEGVLTIEKLYTREFGNRIYVDLTIGVDGSLSVRQANRIAETVHRRIEKEYSEVKHITVQIKPV